jgi:flagella basal body P-ring formation protein FlgA
MKNLLIGAVAVLATSSAWSGTQEQDGLRETIATFIHAQTSRFHGRTDVQVGAIDGRLRLPACDAPQAFIPTGEHLLGNSVAGLRCPASADGNSWTIFVPVRIRVHTVLLVASRSLSRGQVLTEADFYQQDGEMTQTDSITDPAAATGKILTRSVAAGQTLSQGMLRAPYTIRQGQSVAVVVSGRGYEIAYEGQALNDAAEGQAVQVRSEQGRTISGLAHRDGTVNVAQ